MGDVYRADDLKLDQAVALKFLARGRGEDPTWLLRYRNEVRLARKVTHPDVIASTTSARRKGRSSSRWNTSMAKTWLRCCVVLTG